MDSLESSWAIHTVWMADGRFLSESWSVNNLPTLSGIHLVKGSGLSFYDGVKMDSFSAISIGKCRGRLFQAPTNHPWTKETR